MRISHEAIYQSLFSRAWCAQARAGHVSAHGARAAGAEARSRNKPQGHGTADVVLGERPAEAEDRAALAIGKAT
jgi:IS30 family transposase